MRREGIAVIVVLGLVVAALELTLPVGAAGGKPASDVNVVNTPTVTVVNTPTNAVPVYQALAPTQVFRMVFGGIALDGQGSGLSSQTFTVPANTLLIIEMVSGETSLPAGELPLLSITSKKEGNPSVIFSYLVPLTNLGAVLSSNFYQGTSLVRIYAQAGEDVYVSLSRFGITGEASFSATVSGYLVPLPTP